MPELFATKGPNGRPTIKKGRPWFVYYYFLNPANGIFTRFKVYDGLNKIDNVEGRLAASKITIAQYTDMLKNLGFNPYSQAPIPTAAPEPRFALAPLIRDYLAEKEETLIPGNLVSYTKLLEDFNNYCIIPDAEPVQANQVTKVTVKSFLSAGSFLVKGIKKKWSGKTYNEYLSQLNQFFTWVADLDSSPILVSPGLKIKKRPVIKEANPPLTDKDLAAVLEYAQHADPYFYFFYRLMYYTCLRPTREARLLKVGYIDPVGMQINLPGKLSKTGKKMGKGRQIQLAPQLLEIFTERGTLDAPKDFFIFTVGGQPGVTPVGVTTFGRKFNRIKEKIGLGKEAKFYAIKHTRVCHMVIDKVPLYKIQKLTGHSTLAQLMDYLKGLNLIIDESEPLNSRTL